MKIFKHSILNINNNSNSNSNNNSTNPYSNLLLGEIIICFTNANLYAKLTDSNVVAVGNSVRKFSDLLDYIQGVDSSNETYSLVKLIKNNKSSNYFSITTTYPFISVKDLLESTITSDIDYYYIGVTNTDQLDNIAQKQFKLEELNDVNITNLLTANYDKYVLTYVSGGYNTKDYFNPYLYGTWTLKPETSKLALLEDVEYNPPSQGWIVKNIPEVEHSPNIDRTASLRIQWDTTPKLSNSLNCNNYYINNLSYNTNIITLNNLIETVNIDLNLYSIFYINCVNTQVITFNVLYKFNLNTNKPSVNINTVILDNFIGILQFANVEIEYENGIAPELVGSCNIFNLLTYQGDSSIITKVTQRGISLSNVDQGVL
jgi:hypothetical protein